MTWPYATAAEVWAQYDGRASENDPPAYLGEAVESAAAIVELETKRTFWADAERRPTGLAVPSGGLAADAATIAIDAAARVGEVWAIGGEVMYVAAHSGGELYLDRGELDTGAEAHGEGAAILRLVAPAEIRQLTIALAVRWVRGTAAGWSAGDLGMNGAGGTFVAERMPADLDRLLRRYRRVILP